DLRLHRLVFGEPGGRLDALGHRLAHGGARQARLLLRARDPDPRSATRGGHRAPRNGPGEPRADRARIARDDLRPDPVDLDPGHVLRHRRPWHRDLHQPARRNRTDRRRAIASSRRAIATPSTAPPTTSSGQCTPTYTRE